MEEELINEIERKLLKDKNFKKELTVALVNDYINDPKTLSLTEIKKRTENLVRYVAELELQEMYGEEDEEQPEELIDN